MSADNEPDWNLVDFAKQVAGIPNRIAEAGYPGGSFSERTERTAVPEETANQKPTEAVLEPPVEVIQKQGQEATSLQRTKVDAEGHASGKKQSRTPDEIEKVILETLRTIDNCPKRGFVITVYGSNPWNAMLTIKPEAGAAINHALWTSRVHDIGVRLRADFDVV